MAAAARSQSPKRLTLGLNRAVTLIAEKIAKGPRGRRFGSDPSRSLGEHPEKGGPVVVKSGRYGPYVSHDGVNATIPKTKIGACGVGNKHARVSAAYYQPAW
jgi:topoisomerase IA-like protein